jgi:DNA-binding MarR family transcriptional regulator
LDFPLEIGLETGEYVYHMPVGGTHNARRDSERSARGARTDGRWFDDPPQELEERFLAAFDRELATVEAVVARAYRSERRPREQLRAGLATLLDHLDRNPEAASVLIVEPLRAGPRVAARRTEVLAQLAGVVHKAGVRAMRADQREPPPLTEEAVVSAVLGMLHARVSTPWWGNGAGPSPQLVVLVGPLMALMLVPYVGAKTASKELFAPALRMLRPGEVPASVPWDELPEELADLPSRVSRLTASTIVFIGQMNERGGAPSNRDVSWATGDTDAGQMSKLLTRLEALGLIENTTDHGNGRGRANEWRLTDRGRELARVIEARSGEARRSA